MESSEATTPRPGLRERKKQRTRETIARVALRLFAERGYGQTTLAEIADAADVSTRTIFAYYQGKEDILFSDLPVQFDRLQQALENRAPGISTLDALSDFLAGLDPRDEQVGLRKEVVAQNVGLRRAEGARFARVEELIAESIAKDLDAQPGDIRPLLVAASMTAAFRAARSRIESELGEPISHEQARAVMDEVLDFLRGGLDRLKGH